jgi:hypothetical protein
MDQERFHSLTTKFADFYLSQPDSRSEMLSSLMLVQFGPGRGDLIPLVPATDKSIKALRQLIAEVAPDNVGFLFTAEEARTAKDALVAVSVGLEECLMSIADFQSPGRLGTWRRIRPDQIEELKSPWVQAAQNGLLLAQVAV